MSIYMDYSAFYEKQKKLAKSRGFIASDSRFKFRISDYTKWLDREFLQVPFMVKKPVSLDVSHSIVSDFMLACSLESQIPSGVTFAEYPFKFEVADESDYRKKILNTLDGFASSLCVNESFYGDVTLLNMCGIDKIRKFQRDVRSVMAFNHAMDEGLLSEDILSKPNKPLYPGLVELAGSLESLCDSYVLQNHGRFLGYGKPLDDVYSSSMLTLSLDNPSLTKKNLGAFYEAVVKTYEPALLHPQYQVEHVASPVMLLAGSLSTLSDNMQELDDSCKPYTDVVHRVAKKSLSVVKGYFADASFQDKSYLMKSFVLNIYKTTAAIGKFNGLSESKKEAFLHSFTAGSDSSVLEVDTSNVLSHHRDMDVLHK